MLSIAADFCDMSLGASGASSRLHNVHRMHRCITKYHVEPVYSSSAQGLSLVQRQRGVQFTVDSKLDLNLEDIIRYTETLGGKGFDARRLVGYFAPGVSWIARCAVSKTIGTHVYVCRVHWPRSTTHCPICAYERFQMVVQIQIRNN